MARVTHQGREANKKRKQTKQKKKKEGREAAGLDGRETGRLLVLVRVHGTCRNSFAGAPQLASAGVSLGTGSEGQSKGNTETLGKGFFWKTDTNATHPKQAE